MSREKLDVLKTYLKTMGSQATLFSETEQEGCPEEEDEYQYDEDAPEMTNFLASYLQELRKMLD